MARTRSLLAVLMLLFAASLAAAQTDWNAAQNWSTTGNPPSGGAWTYGAKAGSTSGTFVAYTTYLNPASDPQRDEWTGGGGASAIFHNAVGAGGDIPAGMLVLTPDPTNLAIARWTAPAAGFYAVQGQFNALNTSNATVQVMVNSSFARTGFLSGGTSNFPFTVYLNVASGAHVDFVVKPSGIAGADDSTGLNVAIHSVTANRSGTGAGTVVPFNTLQLTNNTFQAGSIWTTGPQSVGSGFDTTFTYQINSFSTPPGEGFTFTIQNDPAGASYLGADGGALGVAGLTHALVFEMNDDTALSATPHMWVLTGGTGAVDTTPTSNGVTTLGSFDFANFSPAFSGTHQVRVKYVVGNAPTLYVFLDSAAGGNGVLDVNAPVLTMPFDLGTQLGLTTGNAIIGFTGGTSADWQTVQITNWQFASLDTVPPVFSSVSNITMEANQLGGADVSYTAPTATDAVDGSRPVTCTPDSGSLFPVATTTVTCTATDLSGNTAQTTFTVTVTDTTPPTLALPGTITGEAAGASGLAVSYIATATDIVDGNVTPVCAPASGSTFPLGTTAVNCTATDAHKNQATGSFNVTIQDTTPPTINGTPSNMTLEATGAGGAVATWAAPTASDLVDGTDPVICSPASGSTFALGTTPVSCTATDAHGNKASTSFTVNVQDTTAPAISGVPSNMTVEASSASGAAVSWTAPTASDLVDGTDSVICSPASGTNFGFGTTTVNCTATDAHGNKASASFTVTVQDTTAPSISGVPSNMTLEATGPSGAIATWTAPTATDLVDGSVAVLCAPPSGSTFGITTTVVTCSATDAHGNKASASFSVTVHDTTPPTLSLPGNITAAATSSSGAVVTFTATATDLVDGSDPVLCSPASGATFAAGSTTVSCSATDAHGNTASGSFSVTVNAPTTSFSVRLLYDPNHAQQTGSVYPVLLQVLDATGKNVSSPSLVLTATGVQSLTGGTPGPLQSAGDANPGLQFRYSPDFGGYIFNLKLDGYSAGGYALLFTVGSDGGHGAPFSVTVNPDNTPNAGARNNGKGDNRGKDDGRKHDDRSQHNDRDNH